MPLPDVNFFYKMVAKRYGFRALRSEVCRGNSKGDEPTLVLIRVQKIATGLCKAKRRKRALGLESGSSMASAATNLCEPSVGPAASAGNFSLVKKHMS